MRIGLLGTGPWAGLVHAPVLEAHEDLDFVGVWGRRPEAAEELADRHRTRAYDDVDALLADVDAVAVALPPDVQARLAVRAAGAGRHLLLDKPVAATVTGARAVARAVREAQVASVVFFTTRFVSEPRAWIARQAAAGGWFTAHAQWLGDVFHEESESPFATPWRGEKGALWDVGPHALSVLLPVLGDVRRVAAAAQGPGDTVHAVLDHANGASSTLTLSLTAPPAAAGASLELRGTAGVTRLPQGGADAADALTRAADELLAAARDRRPHPCDAAFGLRVTEVLADVETLLAEGARRLYAPDLRGD
ncbi:Gfo/Idh/MocA family protein [Streptomyces sp. IBSBF 2806]|uniref:Gfo/Idh/MocA family protein n=1 Tax=Streptomyces sp. IBSBF 2806 TaxID=2903529 RepID=UPI002FDC0F99